MFLRNAWYCAAWSGELGDTPLARTILGEKLVLFRDPDGQVLALSDVCPHRYAPLSKGKVIEGTIQCPYHGLRFGAGGRCALNPHGPSDIPGLQIIAHPVVERHGIAWIWMGEPDEADTARITDFPMHEDPGFVTTYDMLTVGASYQMIVDNLLDFSHVEFLHPFLAMSEREFEMVVDGDTVIQITRTIDQPKSGAFEMFWPEGPERINSYTTLRWEAPGNMLLTVRTSPADAPDAAGILLENPHLLTPETATTTHYFWSLARDFQRDVPGYSESMQTAVATVFKDEDAWIMELAQENMGNETDIIALRAAVLPSDKWAMKARLITRKLLRAEAGARPESDTQKQIKIGE